MTSSFFSGDEQHEVVEEGSNRLALPTTPPSTTGLHFRCHDDRENYLDVLYPTAVVGDPLVMVGRSSSVHVTIHVNCSLRVLRFVFLIKKRNKGNVGLGCS